jgi:hypothetical protein
MTMQQQVLPERVQYQASFLGDGTPVLDVFTL